MAQAESWEVNPETRDCIQQGGSPVPTRSLKMPAFNRLRIQRGNWLYAPDDRYGSDYHLQKRHFSRSQPNAIAQIGQRALEPLLEDGRASDVVVNQVQIPNALRSNAGIEVMIFDDQGEPEQLVLPPLVGG